MTDDRREHLIRFYALLDSLERRVEGERKLADCSARMHWPRRGVYFFREGGETRSDSGTGPRIVRVGTHALKAGSGTRLWTRLSQHKGQAVSGGGNHRGSIFRLIFGTALVARHAHSFPTWGVGNAAKGNIRKAELSLECGVTRVLGEMSFLWLAIEDEPGPGSLRGYIERNSIALLSNYVRDPLDQPSPSWLGTQCDRERVRKSGLWNSKHVDEEYEPAFLDKLTLLIAATGDAP